MSIAANDLVQSMSSILQEAKKHLLATQNIQNSSEDTQRREISFDVGTQVLLSTSNIKLKMSRQKSSYLDGLILLKY